jgi:hypothetical protein
VPQRDVYTSLSDCQRDWAAQGQQCEQVRDGRFSNGWYYGPRYYGSNWPSGRPKASPGAVEAVRSPGTTSSSRSWFGSRSSSTTSRGGFGSSGRTSIS